MLFVNIVGFAIAALILWWVVWPPHRRGDWKGLANSGVVLLTQGALSLFFYLKDKHPGGIEYTWQWTLPLGAAILAYGRYRDHAARKT
jgi:threonine/homoserine efflux transporter RhtA